MRPAKVLRAATDSFSKDATMNWRRILLSASALALLAANQAMAAVAFLFHSYNRLSN
jgi:hypothetical protein